MTVDGVRFACSDGFHDYAEGEDADVLTLVKTPEMVERLRDLVDGRTGARVVELGIAFGGSVALLSLLTRPTKLVALDLSPDPVEPLERFIARQHLEARVKPHYGIDQADRDGLAAVVADEFGDEPLDLVIDDASHQYHPTRTSFECLFPRLRPGGLYLIEDWAWMHRFAESLRAAAADDAVVRGQVAAAMEADAPTDLELPLSRFAAELMLLVAADDGIVDTVSVDPQWIVVRRGEAPLDPDGFRLDEVLEDDFATLSTVPTPADDERSTPRLGE